MRPKLQGTLTILAALILGGCQPSSSVTNKDFTELGMTVEDLVARVRNLETDRAALQAQLDNLRTQAEFTPFRESAEFDPADSSYQRADARLTPFAVSIADFRPLGDGVRVKIKLGNLSAATFTGAKLVILYGPRKPPGGDTSGTWAASLQEREQTLTATLLPGHWNPVDVTLPKIDAKQLGYMRVRVATDVVALSQ